MSKYQSLWEYVGKREDAKFKLTFAEIESMTGFPVDHSFLKYKSELLVYGVAVGKISMKERTVEFSRNKQDD